MFLKTCWKLFPDMILLHNSSSNTQYRCKTGAIFCDLPNYHFMEAVVAQGRAVEKVFPLLSMCRVFTNCVLKCWEEVENTCPWKIDLFWIDNCNNVVNLSMPMLQQSIQNLSKNKIQRLWTYWLFWLTLSAMW